MSEEIRLIAEKPLEYNNDVNQHIISCRISIAIINEQQNLIKELENKLKSQEENLKTIRIQEKIIKECYKIIDELK